MSDSEETPVERPAPLFNTSELERISEGQQREVSWTGQTEQIFIQSGKRLVSKLKKKIAAGWLALLLPGTGFASFMVGNSSESDTSPADAPCACDENQIATAQAKLDECRDQVGQLLHLIDSE